MVRLIRRVTLIQTTTLTSMMDYQNMKPKPSIQKRPSPSEILQAASVVSSKKKKRGTWLDALDSETKKSLNDLREMYRTSPTKTADKRSIADTLIDKWKLPVSQRSLVDFLSARD